MKSIIMIKYFQKNPEI